MGFIPLLVEALSRLWKSTKSEAARELPNPLRMPPGIAARPPVRTGLPPDQAIDVSCLPVERPDLKPPAPQTYSWVWIVVGLGFLLVIGNAAVSHWIRSTAEEKRLRAEQAERAVREGKIRELATTLLREKGFGDLEKAASCTAGQFLLLDKGPQRFGVEVAGYVTREGRPSRVKLMFFDLRAGTPSTLPTPEELALIEIVLNGETVWEYEPPKPSENSEPERNDPA
jgi:hypothetical protein